ncbi:hypothetical protein SAY86_016912 [Trapa natans]|uniref:Peptidyl-prolyl cis-trans isomerase n=1 Tax=Trapa natans TaxID=22666 RepID=A0AAN7M0E6_TRANT|nr:hypothetical protein SAY86_016912 [Trapa natans]
MNKNINKLFATSRASSSKTKTNCSLPLSAKIDRQQPSSSSDPTDPKKRDCSSPASAKEKHHHQQQQHHHQQQQHHHQQQQHHHHHLKKRKMSSSNQVRASHILIKHQGSRRKASWKDPEGRVITSTTRESAVSQLKAFRDDIISGKVNFEDIATRYSDCSSAKRGGDLGPFGRGQMQKPFEETTFALKVGEISDIVDTDSGVHIIMRTG